ncbi:DIS3-like exonuclease 2 [Ornithodoros turicata]|uniref:DIS3-like exonuclease 2 n=1 Tax=Ornithodoros turicata TaxID=34597 RepID=UPI00313869B0
MEDSTVPPGSESQRVAHVNRSLNHLSLEGATPKRRGGQQQQRGTGSSQPRRQSKKSSPDAAFDTKPSRTSGRHSKGKHVPQLRSSLLPSPQGAHTVGDLQYLRSPPRHGAPPPISASASRIPVPSSSSSSSSSAWTPPDLRNRAFSDPRPQVGNFLPDDVRSRHAGHRCTRSGSESTSTPSASYRSAYTPSSVLSSLGTGHSNSPVSESTGLSLATSQKQRNKSRNAKYDAYMPLCEVQHALKKGEVLEGVLRINPRNYEDSFISAPDSQMDIYVGGLHDRNRALNGDVVAVLVKPQSQWKIHWDKIRQWEQQSHRSILEVLDPDWDAASLTPASQASKRETQPVNADEPQQSPADGNVQSSTNSAVDEGAFSSVPELDKNDEAEGDGCGHLQDDDDFFSDSPPLSQGSNWDGLSHVPFVRPPDTIEVLGIERLLGQVQEYVEKQKKGHRSKSSQTKVSMPCSLEATLTPIPPSGAHYNFGTGDEVSPPRPEEKVAPRPQDDDPSCDPWALHDDNDTTVVFSPEELLEVPEEELEACRRNAGQWVVAPDELTGEEDWNDQSQSDNESGGSLILEQHIEDMEFLRAAQDARNNNVEEDVLLVPDVVHVDPVGQDPPQSTVCEGAGLERNRVSNCAPPTGSTSSRTQGPVSKVDGKVDSSVDVSGKDASIVEDVLNSPPRCSLEARDTRNKGKASTKKKRKNKGKEGKKTKAKKEPDPVMSGASASTTSTARLREQSKYEQLSVVDIMRHPSWRHFVQKTGKVVHILECKNSRVTAGHLKLLNDNNPTWVLFSPKDSRFPRMMIPSQECPPAFFHRPGDYADTLFLAELTEWLPESNFARGRLRKLLGKSGDVSVETEAILESYSVDHGDFPEDVFGDLDVSENWSVPESEVANRRDFRDQLVFTIDPKTARDLDDAMSCRRVGDLWEIGVHIADVTYFVKEGTCLDNIAKRRATSVYLVQMVVPMLPRLLCDHLCSLHPGEDKLTFSVVWKMTDEGRIVEEWFGRSVIRSCCKLSYEHAQAMLDRPDEGCSLNGLPPIHDNHSGEELTKAVCTLHRMATLLRKRRFENGALRLDQLKVVFALNENCYPVGFSIYEHTESHQLIEEFMLLANMAVAHKLYKTYPDKAFLRCHPSPDDAQLYEVVTMCAAHGIHLDVASAGALQESLRKVTLEGDGSRAVVCVLTNLLSKPMKMAQYFCSGTRDDPELYAHYALNVPLYTHFTSPIRRYADIMVHRQLAAAVAKAPLPLCSPKELQKVASHCNDKKTNGRLAGELSTELFLYIFIKECKKFEDRAMVTGVLEHAFDVLSLSLGIIKRVYCDKLGTKSFSHRKEDGKNFIELRYQSVKGDAEDVVDVITAFRVVDIVIVTLPEVLKYQVTVKPPPATVPVEPVKKGNMREKV